MIVLINPGAGPVSGATARQAKANMRQLLVDADVEARVTRDARHDEGGRYRYNVRRGRKRAYVDMPGAPLYQVRDLDGPLPSIPPRLYINGDSWYWVFAVPHLREALGLSRRPVDNERCGMPPQFMIEED